MVALVLYSTSIVIVPVTTCTRVGTRNHRRRRHRRGDGHGGSGGQ